jgi:hypothetical protein
MQREKQGSSLRTSDTVKDTRAHKNFKAIWVSEAPRVNKWLSFQGERNLKNKQLQWLASVAS